MPPNSPKRRSRGSTEIQQRETFRITPDIKSRARIIDPYAPPRGPNAAQQFGAAISGILGTAKAAAPIIEKAQEDAFVAGEMAALRGEVAPDERTLNILNLQQRQVDGYERVTGQSDVVKFTAELDKMLLEETQGGFPTANIDEITNKFNQVFQDYAGGYADSEAYMKAFAPSASRVLEQTKMEYTRLLGQHNVNNYLDKQRTTVGSNVTGVITMSAGVADVAQATRSAAGRKLVTESVMENADAFADAIRGQISEAQALAKADGYGGLNDSISKMYLDEVGAIAANNGLPELLLGFTKPDESGVSVVGSSLQAKQSFDRSMELAKRNAEALPRIIDQREEKEWKVAQNGLLSDIHAIYNSTQQGVQGLSQEESDKVMDAMAVSIRSMVSQFQEQNPDTPLDAATYNSVSLIIHNAAGEARGSARSPDRDGYRRFYEETLGVNDPDKILEALNSNLAGMSNSEANNARSLYTSALSGQKTAISQAANRTLSHYTSQMEALSKIPGFDVNASAEYLLELKGAMYDWARTNATDAEPFPRPTAGDVEGIAKPILERHRKFHADRKAISAEITDVAGPSGIGGSKNLVTVKGVDVRNVMKASDELYQELTVEGKPPTPDSINKVLDVYRSGIFESADEFEAYLGRINLGEDSPHREMLDEAVNVAQANAEVEETEGKPKVSDPRVLEAIEALPPENIGGVLGLGQKALGGPLSLLAGTAKEGLEGVSDTAKASKEGLAQFGIFSAKLLTADRKEAGDLLFGSTKDQEPFQPGIVTKVGEPAKKKVKVPEKPVAPLKEADGSGQLPTGLRAIPESALLGLKTLVSDMSGESNVLGRALYQGITTDNIIQLLIDNELGGRPPGSVKAPKPAKPPKDEPKDTAPLPKGIKGVPGSVLLGMKTLLSDLRGESDVFGESLVQGITTDNIIQLLIDNELVKRFKASEDE